MTLDEVNAYLASENSKHTSEFQKIEKDTWPAHWTPADGKMPFVTWRNNRFLVQLFRLDHGVIRMTVNRTLLASEGRWVDGITWDELSAIKSQLGYGHRDGIEFYPRDSKIVNEANMRHIFILTEPLPFMWGA